MTSVNDSADHILYRVYYSLMAGDILHHLGYDATAKNKEILHKFHKRVLGYKTISALTQEQLSVFLFSVCVFWAERGIFVRTNSRQPWGLQDMELAELWDVL